MPDFDPPAGDVQTLHATCVAVGGKGILILGKSGAGKSALALQLIALGATLVADDQTHVWQRDDQLFARAPKNIHGQIEARGIGLLRLPALQEIRLDLAVDLDQPSQNRLPDPAYFRVAGGQLPCVHRVEGPHLAASIFLLAQGAYLDPNDPI